MAMTWPTEKEHDETDDVCLTALGSGSHHSLSSVPTVQSTWEKRSRRTTCVTQGSRAPCCHLQGELVKLPSPRLALPARPAQAAAARHAALKPGVGRRRWACSLAC